jgi:dTMP kinase
MTLPSPAARFISFEGIDGCGKSTLLEQLAKWLGEAGVRYLKTREPGGTRLGEKIRGLLLDPAHGPVGHRTEVLLYTASRAQLVQEVIIPALRQDVWVLADRFSDATLAYQGYGRGIDVEWLRRMQDWATQGLWPHRTILLDCELEIAWQRMSVSRDNPDRIEQEHRDFHRRVREGYLELARNEPERFLVLDGGRPLAKVIEDFQERFWLPLLQGALL